MSLSSSSVSRRGFLAGAGSAAAALALTACGGTSDATDADSGATTTAGTFTYAIAGDPGSNVNPVTTSDRYGLMTLKLLFSQLYVVRAEGIQWFLAESYDESDDHLEFTFHLRSDVTWSDGEPFTADDVVFTYETIASLETADAYSSINYGDDGVVAVEAVDENTVKFTFPFVNAAALEKLQGPDGVFIFPKHVYEGVEDFENNDVNANPVGTGAYTLADYQAGSYLQFAAREDYFGGTPGPKTVVYQIITNENTGMQAIQANTVDAWIATATQAQQLDTEANGLTITPYSEGRVAYFNFNTKRVDNEDLRKALFYSLDKKAIADAAVLSDEYYSLEYTFLPTNSQFYNEDVVEKYDRDLDLAKQLLASAGVEAPTLTLAYIGTDTLQTNASLMIQEQAAEAGITIDLRALESAALYAAQKEEEPEYDMFFSGYIMGIDPDSYSGLFTSGSTSNYAKYEDETIDSLFAQGRQETDDDARHQIYDQLQAEIQDRAIIYPLYSNDRLLVTTARVSGIEDAKLIPIFTFEEVDKLVITD